MSVVKKTTAASDEEESMQIGDPAESLDVTILKQREFYLNRHLSASVEILRLCSVLSHDKQVFHS